MLGEDQAEPGTAFIPMWTAPPVRAPGMRTRHVGGLDAMRPWLDVSYWELSGEDDATDSDNSNFVSLESNSDTIVVEDAYYGLDIDTNYRAAKIKGGLNLAEDWSLADSFYFTVVALSTIGFGDFTPTTTFSRLFTVLYAIIGVGLIGTLLNLVVTNAQHALKQRGPDSDGPGN